MIYQNQDKWCLFRILWLTSLKLLQTNKGYTGTSTLGPQTALFFLIGQPSNFFGAQHRSLSTFIFDPPPCMALGQRFDF